MAYLEIALNIPENQTFTYLDLPQDTQKVSNIEESAQGKLFEEKKKRSLVNYKAQVGKRAEVKFGNKRLTGIIMAVRDKLPEDFNLAPEKIRTITRVIDSQPLLTTELLTTARWMSDYYLCPIGEIVNSMIPSGKRETDAPGFSFVEDYNNRRDIKLSEEQNSAVEKITRDISENKIHYLYGKTGTGKTEVFLTCAEKVLKAGKGIIYLVPEIGLTKQAIEVFTERFGQTVAVLHSGLTASQKLSEWNRILEKKARIVIGARSAVFAPVPDLGMIIIDEEHDGSYKSNNTPRYHARQIAMYRCARNSIPLLMGSATPSVEAWNSISNESFVCHKLTKRLAGGQMPLIKAIDLSQHNMNGIAISPPLENEIRKTLEEKRQTILFMNRRGFNHFYRCNSCGFELKCKNCSVSMTYHLSANRLKCHYCGWSVTPPSMCPNCGSFDTGYSGFGTEYIETEVRSKFPNARVVRLDSDNLTKKGEFDEKIAAFKNGEYDILLGTQMVAKGLNFPNLKLVGVILADTGLHLPDFRSAEKTFALITQVAGRAGRFFPDGKVYVQTYNPGSAPIYCAVKNLTNEFYSYEITQRKLLGFPPFSRIVRLVFRSASLQNAQSTAEEAFKITGEYFEELQKKFPGQCENVEILGVSECPLAVISNNYRFQIILKSDNIAILQKIVKHLIYDYRRPANVYIEVDVDPNSLL
ncbi:MAG: primosomal protein N' [Treponema sp.]|nr:primosomal protein N' [Treponema sp.]